MEDVTMARYLPETRKVKAGAKRTVTKKDIVVHVRNKVPENYEGFVLEFCGGSEDRALEWVVSHIVQDENVDVRLAVEGLEPQPNETPENFQSRCDKAAQLEVDGWDCVKTRRAGTGVGSKAKLGDEIAEMFAQGKPRAEIDAKLKEYAERFGLAAKK